MFRSRRGSRRMRSSTDTRIAPEAAVDHPQLDFGLLASTFSLDVIACVMLAWKVRHEHVIARACPQRPKHGKQKAYGRREDHERPGHSDSAHTV